MAPFLQELIFDVFLRLPAKSLLRFRCLSNSSCTEIDSSDFTRKHLKRLIETKHGRKLILRDRTNFYVSDFDDELRKVIKFNYLSITKTRSSFRIYGAFGGLILILSVDDDETKTEELMLWNPTTRRCKKLPTCPVLNTGCRVLKSCGLGYDHIIDDYKVVVFSLLLGKEDYKLWKIGVWIFSLKLNSWRWSQDLNHNEFGDINGRPGFVNGALYWVCRLREQVCGFDIADEKLFTIPYFHPSQQHSVSCPVAFLQLEGYIVGCECWTRFQDFYLFVSEKDGAKGEGNWRKAFRCNGRINMSSCYIGGIRRRRQPFFSMEALNQTLEQPLAYSKEGDCLLFQCLEDFYWYNFENGTREKVMLIGLPRSPPGCCPKYFDWGAFICPDDDRGPVCYDSLVFFESLVSLNDDSLTFPV